MTNNLSIQEALAQGVEAHKAGKVQEADRYYTAILQVQPNHPDANHNMGVLAVGIGKVTEALPFFKKALDANPNIEQFWLSYIDALIKLNQIDEAQTACDQAKKNNITDNVLNILQQKLTHLSADPNPSQDNLQGLVNLFGQGKLNEALDEATKLIKKLPNSPELYNIYGAVNAGLQNYDQAIEAYKKAISIKPDYVEALNNMGVAFEEQRNLDEAIKTFKKALDVNPNFSEALINIGNALISFYHQGQIYF